MPRTTSEDGVAHTSETSGSQPDSNLAHLNDTAEDARCNSIGHAIQTARIFHSLARLIRAILLCSAYALKCWLFQ